MSEFGNVLQMLRNRVRALNRWGPANHTVLNRYLSYAASARRGAYQPSGRFGTRTVNRATRNAGLNQQNAEFLLLLQQLGAPASYINNARRRLREARKRKRSASPHRTSPKNRKSPPPPSPGTLSAWRKSARSKSRGARMLEAARASAR
jgi:hypothetical protein